ncbi:unnamed protein product, partial [Musa hybrid cultivar]
WERAPWPVSVRSLPPPLPVRSLKEPRGPTAVFGERSARDDFTNSALPVFLTHLRITGTATRAVIGGHVGPHVVDLREQSATWQPSDAIVRCGVEVEQTGDPWEAHPVSFILSSLSLPPSLLLY